MDPWGFALLIVVILAVAAVGIAWIIPRSRRLEVGGVELSWSRTAETAGKDRRTYQEKLEQAQSDEVFRYVFLINNASVEQYVSQSRSQAEDSFTLSRRAAMAGFALLLISIAIGVVAERTEHPLSVAYLAGVGGAITQFIAGVFFWLYNRTLQQIHIFYQGIMTQQTEALAAIGRASEAAREAEKGRALAQAVIADAAPITDDAPTRTEEPGDLSGL